eukprot:2881475-Rhodomonas_salina.2
MGTRGLVSDSLLKEVGLSRGTDKFRPVVRSDNARFPHVDDELLEQIKGGVPCSTLVDPLLLRAAITD